ncbi:S8 family serine peptidase [Microbacterium mangrovi]|uniref:S8 family serine peptidase n=1 Tax=Microbacterium mangrovi TaxID=1348253 RepID=UPI0018CDE517|nr:S8 family serine peptidase [Microbacterium mangrovi]
MRRVVGAAVALALLAVPLLGAGTSASASEQASNWWYDRYGVAQAHDAGWTGKGVKIAVIDLQINSKLPVFSDARLTVDHDPLCEDGTVESTVADHDTLHGSDITALLVGNGRGQGSVRGIAPDASVTFYGLGFPTCAQDARPGTQVGIAEGIERAIADGADIISLSVSLPSMNPGSIQAVADAIGHGVIVVAAQPNSTTGAEAATPYPMVLNGVVTVNALDDKGLLQRDADDPSKQDVWPEVTVVAAGVGFPSVNWTQRQSITGSSLATPLVAGMLADTWQKYPDATANQLIQSLIRNTGTTTHELTVQTNGIGYGAASLRHLLAVDPTKYADTNPLMNKASGKPTAAQVAAVEASPKPSASAATGAVAVSVSATPFVVGGVGLLVVIVALLVLTIILVRRSRRTNDEEHT